MGTRIRRRISRLLGTSALATMLCCAVTLSAFAAIPSSNGRPATSAAGPKALAITVSAQPYIVFGSRVGITGTVKPAVSGLYLVLQQQHGSSWVPVAGGHVNGQGAFVIVGRPRKPGTVTYRVATQRSSKLVAGASRPVSIDVDQWHYLSDLDSVDGSNRGGSASVDGRRYAQSIEFGTCNVGSHAYSEWNLGHHYQQFVADVGIDDSQSSGVTGSFSIVVDGAKVASGKLALGEVIPVKVSVHGGFRLRVDVTVDPHDQPGDWTYCAESGVVLGNARLLG